MCVHACDFFFPFKSCCSCRRRRRSPLQKESMHAFIFCLSFYLQGDIQCQLLPFDRRQSPPGQNKFEKRGGRREGNAPPPSQNAGVSIAWAPRSQTLPGPPPNPEKPFSLLPTGPRQRIGTKTARKHPPRPDTHLSVASPVCRPLTTGAIFVSQ